MPPPVGPSDRVCQYLGVLQGQNALGAHHIDASARLVAGLPSIRESAMFIAPAAYGARRRKQPHVY